MSASLFLTVRSFWMIFSGLDEKTHYVFRLIKLHIFHFICVDDVLHHGSVMEVWWLVIYTNCNQNFRWWFLLGYIIYIYECINVAMDVQTICYVVLGCSVIFFIHLWSRHIFRDRLFYIASEICNIANIFEDK